MLDTFFEDKVMKITRFGCTWFDKEPDQED